MSSVSGGLVFGMTDFSNFYIFLVQGDGQAAIVRRQNNGWLVPVPNKAAPGFKAGGANMLRVTWKGGSGAAYINDQLVFNFKYQPFTNGKFGLYTEGGNTYTFANIKLTNWRRSEAYQIRVMRLIRVASLGRGSDISVMRLG